MKSIAIAEIKQETNTFSPLSTCLDSFQKEGYFLRGKEITEQLADTNTEIGGFFTGCHQAGLSPVPLVAAWAISGGPLSSTARDKLLNELLESVGNGGPFAGVLLSLHGALVAEDCDDVEGQILTRLREQLGPTVPIVTTLDMHGNLTEEIARSVNAIVPYHTNPHTDMGACGEKAAAILGRIVAEELTTVCTMRKLPMVIPPENSMTTAGPLKEIMDCVREIERDPGVLAAGVFPVQPWLDIEGLGNAVTVTTTGADADDKANRDCRQLAELFWSKRDQFLSDLVPIKQAIEMACHTDGLCVFADSADGTGSGSPGDATFVLRHLLGADLQRPALVPLVDPDVADQACALGEGVTIQAAVGGKMDCVFNSPVEIEGGIIYAGEASFTVQQGAAFAGIEVLLGKSVVIQCGQVHILVTSRRVWTHDPELFRCVGLQPEKANIVVVKSPIMYKAAYASIAEKMFMVDSTGASPENFPALPYRRADRTMFPFDRSSQYSITSSH